MTSSEISDIINDFSSSIDVGMASLTRSGSVKLRGVYGGEGRRQIPSHFLESVSSHASLSDAGGLFAQGTIFDDVIPPPDLEQEIESQIEETLQDDENIKALAEFPEDDLEIVSEERQYRTEQRALPALEADFPPLLKSCLVSFTQNYNLVKRKYANYGTNKVDRANLAEWEKQLPKLVYDGDDDDSSGRENSLDSKRASISSGAFDLKSSPADPLLEGLLKFVPQEEVDAENVKLRLENRSTNIFGLYTLVHSPTPSEQMSNNFDDPEFPIENLAPPLPPFEHFGHRLLVKCLSLELEMEIEPIFASIALYDIKVKKKISESFYFELNAEPIRKMIRNKDMQVAASTLARTAIFSLTYPCHDIFIVIKLEKVLQQGDITECAEAYAKDATEKVQEKAKQNAKFYCDRLGRYRMPFAWTAIHLMNIVNSAKNLRPMEEMATSAQSGNESGSKASTLEYKRPSVRRKSSLSEAELNMLSSFKPVTLTVSSFFKQEGEKLKDDDLFKFLADLKRPTNILKKLKCIPGKLKIDISPCPQDFPYCITPDLYKVKPYPDERGRPTREIQEFPSLGVHVPNTTYRNLLYVYPQNVNFTNRPGHFRNIAVKVQLLDCEETVNALPLIYGKSNGPEFLTEAYSAVTYHNKNPDFYEEVKIQLPTKLTSRHHLFFSFYHISCQKKQELSPIETPVGYTWLSLLHNGRLRTGEISLPVAIEKLPPHYSLQTPDSLSSSIKWVDGHKPVFNFTLQLVSTVHSLDKYLERFFSLCEHIEKPVSTTGVHPLKMPDGSLVGDLDAELRRSIIAVAKDSTIQNLVSFLYVIINKITGILSNPPIIDGQSVNMGDVCFEAIVRLSARLHDSPDLSSDSHMRNMLLATYSQYMFSIAPYQPPSSPIVTGPAPSFISSSHYATMTRSEKRTRPAITKATFHISSSNPDLTIPEDEQPSAVDDSVFMRHSPGRASLTEQSAKPSPEANAIRSVAHKLFHEEAVLLFIVSTGNVKEIALQHAWFMFDLISKSMSLHLKDSGGFLSSRQQRFSSRYLDDLQRLIKLVTNEITTRFNRDYDFVERLNCALAFFLNQLISIMDRGVVMQMIHMYCQMVTDRVRVFLGSNPGSLLMLRVELLRIVCSHEHYVTLNLPFVPVLPPSPTPSISSTASSYTSGIGSNYSSQFDLSDRFMRSHFLAGLLLSDIRLCLELADNNQASMQKVMLYALTTLRQLMSSHDADARIAPHPQVKRVVASLYIPLLSIAVKSLSYAHLFSENDRTSTSAVTDDGVVSSSVASAIANPASTQMATGGTESTFMGAECTRNLLICFLWLVKNTERSQLKSWWLSIPPGQLINILDLLYISVSCFECGAKPSFGRNDTARTSMSRTARGKDSKSRLQEAILGGSSARQEMLMRRRGEKSATIGGGGMREGLRWRKDQTEWKQARHGERTRQFSDESPAARNLSSEVMLVVLDSLDLLVETSTELGAAEGSTSQVLSCALRILLHILSKRQGVEVLQHAFALQRAIVAKFPELIFEEETDQCADLSLRLLEKCTSPNMKIRVQSAASLYMLMRHNFSMGNNFARVKMQVTMSMSTLVGVTHDFDEDHLRRSLKTILSYAEADTELEGTSFPDQVRDLIYNLHMILSDTVKMKEHQEDPEMLIDLMYRIAKGYQNSPDLRLTWLQNMAKQHSERKNHAEAGMCLLHCAALVSEYLSMVESSPYIPIGCVAFQNISFNILEESAVSDDVVSPNADALRTEKYFSVSGLVGILEQAAHTFVLAGLHEVVAMVYEVLTPIYNQQKDYKKLANVHTKLSESFSKISSQSGKRMFGTYFRVAFYGSKFGDLNGEEFIYKEPAITKLPEISYRLETFYSQCFGEDKVEVIKDSSVIDTNLLDPDKAYIQITYVDPYFYQYEDDSKTSYFDRWEKVLSPLESACEDVKKKTADLHKAVSLEPPDVRMLQVNLQGAVLTSVNQGPLEIANAFLAEVPVDEPTKWIPYNDLRLSFKKFIYACGLALKKNKSLISSDQKDYQREMERNYNRMVDRMKQMDHGRQVVALIRSQQVTNE